MTDPLLVAFDGGTESTNALRFAATQAAALNSNLHVIHVVEDNEGLTDEIKQSMDEVLENHPASDDIDAVLFFREVNEEDYDEDLTPAAARLSRYLEETSRDYRTVVLGNTHDTRLQSLSLGEFAQDLIRINDTPVTLVP